MNVEEEVEDRHQIIRQKIVAILLNHFELTNILVLQASKF